MKKVLHMTPPEINNGVYRYVFSHIPYMDSNKYQFGFLTRAADELSRSEEYRRFGFNIHPFGATQRDNPEALRNEVTNVLKEYDIIHLHTSSWVGFLIEEIAMENGLEKVIVHSHSTGIDISDENLRKKRMEEHQRNKVLFGPKYATDFCACSREAADWLFGGRIPDEQVHIMPNAIDTARYHFNEMTRMRIREELNVEDRFVLGNVGRYTYQKNQDFLIRVLAELNKVKDSFSLVCIGEGEKKEEYIRLSHELGVYDKVIFVDWVNNVEDYLQAFDTFVLPSRFEGFPISIVEAQASGLQCIVSDTVTKEARITHLVDYCKCEVPLWTDSILNLSERHSERVGYDRIVKEAGFDLLESAKKWDILYG